MEVIYYQALNVTLKGDVHKASEPFRKLVLEDDRLVQYQNKDVFYRVEAYYKQGEPTIKLRLQSLFLTLVGPIFINFMILVASLSFHDSDPNNLSLPVSKYPLLTADVYLVSFLIWISIILVVKCIKRAYLLPFKVFTYNVFNLGGGSIILRNVNCNESDNDGFSYFYGISMPTANGNILKNTVTGRASQ